MPRAIAAVLLWLIALVADAGAAAAQGDAVSLSLLPASSGDPLPQLVLQGDFDAQFAPTALRSTLAPRAEARWFRVDTPAHDGGARVLAIARMPMQSVQLWLPDSRGGYRLEQQSFFHPSWASFSPGSFAFELDRDLRRGDMRPAYLRIRHAGRLYLDVELMSAGSFRNSERVFAAMIVSGLTTLLVMLLFNALFYVVLRERLYALFVAFVGTQLLWVLFATGIAFVLPGGDVLAALPGRASGTLIAASNALLLLFVREFGQVRRYAPRLDGVVLWLARVFFVIAVLFMVPWEAFQVAVARVATFAFSLASPLLLVGIAFVWWRGSRRAGLLWIAWLPLGVMSMMRTAVSWGWIAPSAWTIYAPLQAVAFEAVVLSVGLALRLRSLREERDEALQRADVDAVTGAMSRGSGTARLQAVVEQCRRADEALSIVFIDIDNLKRINDRHGHDAGDASLRTASKRLRSLVPERASLVRWGGDEFLLVAPGLHERDALTLADAMGARLRDAPLDYNGTPISLRASMGVAAARGAALDGDALLQLADMALYRAKREGRDQVVAARDEPRS